MWEGFRNFLMRGNVVELATAVVIGGAFTKIVDGFMKGFVEPLIKLILGSSDPAKSLEVISVGGFPVGMLLAAIVNFLLTAAVVYFFLIRPLSSFAARFAPPPPPPGEDITLLREIRDLLKTQNVR
ncbi:large conductance mechanosensitive channel protein MscL [Deinococcus fonticola]|uniref:large conductance mechanosensitive channel protein MscL n=1 Tax=Deinococcus fonticola TaxID=2528713 RepID=UPI001074FFD4|nr:large conductance mechanosensitive channel protein MscL [Deinococcus fonticola]